MKSNYKKLGQFIRVINVRNKEDRKDNLLGVSTRKVFIDSVANTVGTDFKKYKIVRKNQFTYVPDTSRRGDKMGIAMLETHEQALVSQAYTVFEVAYIDKLSPEYLMMWFRRPEFDRYARFKSHGSVREIFDWEEMCDIELPVPSIEKQREIVREYNVVKDRIALNEKLTQKLEDTAQAIYKQWFVDFEFPISKEYAESIGKRELEGKPYQSSGGEMVFCEKMKQDKPLNWTYGQFGELIKIQSGYSFKSDEFSVSGTRKIIKIKNITPPNISLDESMFYDGILNPKLDKYAVSFGDVLISMTGSTANQMNSAVGQVGRYLLDYSSLMNQRVGKLTLLDDNTSIEFCYQFISNIETHLELLAGSTGSANQANISPSQIEALELALPIPDVMSQYNNLSVPVCNKLALIYKENSKLEELRIIINIKMSKV